MVIEEQVMIDAPLERVWDMFSHLGGWKDWNTVLQGLSCDSAERAGTGAEMECSIRPYAFPVPFRFRIDEVIPRERILWTASKYGITARHEYRFEQVTRGVRVTSREVFTGLPVIFGGLFFPRGRIRQLTVRLLQDLKSAAESGRR